MLVERERADPRLRQPSLVRRGGRGICFFFSFRPMNSPQSGGLIAESLNAGGVGSHVEAPAQDGVGDGAGREQQGSPVQDQRLAVIDFHRTQNSGEN